MPNTPIQIPNIDLPGAEYLALAPNATVAVGGRRVRTFSGSTSVGASSSGSQSIGGTIEYNFQPSSAIYIHDLWLVHDPATGFSQIAVSGVQIGFSYAATPGTPVYRVGASPLTLASPNTATTIVSERDKLILGSDITALGSAGANLMFSAYISYQNSAGGAVSPTANIPIVYTRLDGVIT